MVCGDPREAPVLISARKRRKKEMKAKRLSTWAITAVLAAALFGGPAAASDGLKITGFVDGSYLDAEDSVGTFSLDEVELDFEKKLDEKLSARADLNYRAGDSSGDAALDFDELVEQGYVTYRLEAGTGVDLTFGKFNAPIGFELLDPVDMYQYSHSLVFDNGLPTNLTGVMGAYAFTEQVDVALYAVNGWDNNTDNSDGKALGGRIGITPVEGLNIGLSAIKGTTETNKDDKKSVYDVDITYTGVERLTVGAEFNTGKEDNAGTATGEDDSKWTGFLVMAHYDFTDMIGLTLRYDSFDDKGGSRLDDTDTLAEKRQSYTVAPTFSLGEGAGALVEYRVDKSDEKVFEGGTEDTTGIFAVEFTYSF